MKTSRRKFLTTSAAAGSPKAQNADDQPKIRYSVSPPPLAKGPHTGTLDPRSFTN